MYIQKWQFSLNTYLFFNNFKKETTPLRKEVKLKTFGLFVDEKSQDVLQVEFEKHVMHDNITLQHGMSITQHIY